MDPESNTQTLAPSNNDQPQSEQGLATITKDEYEVSEEAQERLWANEVTRLLEVVTSPATLAFEGSATLAVDSGKAIPRHSQEDFFNFFNYCTAVLARVLCTAVDGKSFAINVLASLAKISTKVKVVSTRLQGWAQISIDNGISDRKIPVPNQHDVRGRQGDNSMIGVGLGDIDLDFEALLGSMQGLRGDLAPLEFSSKKDLIKQMYFPQCAKYRTGVLPLLRFILLSLRGTNNLMRKSVTSYELCSMAHGTGFERFRTLVYQDHENNFLGTSDASMVNYARSSFELLDTTIRHVQGSGSPYSLPPVTTPGDSSGMDNQFKSIDSRNNSVGTRGQ